MCRFESAVTSGVVPSQSRAVISLLSLAASVWVRSKRHLFPGNQESKGIKEQICMSLTVLAISTSGNKLTMTRATEFPKPRKPKSLLSNGFSNSHGLISDRTQYLKKEKKNQVCNEQNERCSVSSKVIESRNQSFTGGYYCSLVPAVHCEKTCTTIGASTFALHIGTSTDLQKLPSWCLFPTGSSVTA